MNTLDKVLLATDGSEKARIAVDLAASLAWPAGTTIEVLEVFEPLMPGIEVPPESLAALERDAEEQIAEALARTKAALHGAVVETAMRRGRAASEVVREAERIDADVIVTGSRGRGPIETMLLGSVAAEVVDRAPCPVLVARLPRVRRVVVADDGSSFAANAVKLVATSPIFQDLPAFAVSVAPVRAFTGAGPVRHEDAKESYARGVDALRGIHSLIADSAAKTLTAGGVPAEPDTRFGDPAQEIISAAFEHEADLIVIGSRGQTGFERLVLGSVARNVLTHAPQSVLIVHPRG